LSTNRRSAQALALVACSALALSACATSSGSGGSSSSTSGSANATTSNKTITWAYEQEYASYNQNTADGHSSANAVVDNAVIGGFWTFKPDGGIQPETDFGTYQKVSDNPLTVKYSINPKAAWSDGVPVECDDMVLTWMSQSGVTGGKGFTPAGTAGYEQQNPPQCKAGDKDVTVTYKTPFVDWNAMYGQSEIMPAHIVEKQAGMTKKFVDYAKSPTSPDLKKAIDFWNKGWALNPGQLKKGIMPSSGPYTIDSWAGGQSITLKANPKWWGTPPKTGTIVLRYIAGNQMAQALQNGEAQIMDPQPQTDIVNQLKGMGSQVNFTTGEQFSWEHVDFNFKSQFKDKNLREAFAKCIPRQQIIDNLIKPQNANAKILQARWRYSFQPGYDELATVPGTKYDTVDIAGAKQLLGGKSVTVKVGWRKDPQALNKRRVDTIALIQASCKQAGFNVVDAGTPTFFDKDWPAGQWDVALFAWQGSPLVSGNNGIYNTGGGQNPQGYSNPQADKLMNQLFQTTDPAAQLGLEKQIETILWGDLFNVPLFTFPAVFATTKNVQGVVYNPTQADVIWNAREWALK
jgi:peptide/nickel transport system substrate-binding protein